MKHPLERARQLATVAAAHADQGERERRLPAPVVDELLTSGLARLVAPTALGGWAPATTLVKWSRRWRPPIHRLAGAGHRPRRHFLSGFVPRRAEAVRRATAPPPACSPRPAGHVHPAASAQRPVGLRQRRQHAAVQGSGMFAFDGDGAMELDPTGAPVLRLAFVPTAAVDVDENWDTVGMRTGSHDTVVRGRFVPRHTLRFTDASWSDDPLFQQPLFAVLGPCLGAVPSAWAGPPRRRRRARHGATPPARPCRRSATSWPSTSWPGRGPAAVGAVATP